MEIDYNVSRDLTLLFTGRIYIVSFTGVFYELWQ